ncbi:glycoside hydrolase [Streptomyces alfalfae]|uniref:Glycoside hydrolase n=1 Tax=Streptomyces alfalfae TaxID=1642299 RepID=A0ABN4VMB5_9ACTN|nr:C40 family peptidase [Streptomyces alfalfae]AYA18011.1 glycoside hydrolase [Streptomyces fradiae]APY87594.1 glycoside hydrolase [Streptomyces alfalfae]QUI32496.1 C40 family peptidase [Streptomyces alfalfae]RXX40128.1 glycoside hydrolase [Streptomyces alfalfae]RZM96624.1 glycoside hydrolase [Streptomyces alfalfae]
MQGVTGKRCSTAATVALICATAVVVTAPGAAHASPSSPTRPTAPTPRSDESLEEVRKEIERLYHDAGVATDAYNAAEEKADKQSEQIVKLSEDIADGRAKLKKLKARAGAAARSQYRGGGMPDEAQLMLSDDPGEFLDGAGRVRQGHKATKSMLTELSRTQEDLRIYAEDATARWKKLEANRKAKAASKRKIKKKIADAEKLESRLEKKERERLRELEKAAAREKQSAWVDSGVLKDIGAKATPQGKKAIAFATAQIGKPYVWGAEGPGSYDCSGLTSKAWAAAGQGIPRTSQEQWKRLPRVDIKNMRPGDLIIYHADASHVGMYVGDGTIVHAPRPGRDVTTAGAGSMRILGVVRPDK